jgi:hypothetical protein
MEAWLITISDLDGVNGRVPYHSGGLPRTFVEFSLRCVLRRCLGRA